MRQRREFVLLAVSCGRACGGEANRAQTKEAKKMGILPTKEARTKY